jgi:SAM-dependent methyltransferase
MKKTLKVIYKKLMPILKWTNPFFDLKKFFLSFPNYILFFKDFRKYRKISNAESLKIKDIYPCIHDNTSSTGFDSHYFYQDIWAFKKVLQNKAPNHVDIGSRLIYVGMLTTITKVTFIDIRPLKATLNNLESKYGTILNLPYKDNSINSLSCLHVAEHIGLGRYGDPLDPQGTIKAINELKRVLAKGGNLYFSLPVGKTRLQFNAHRIHSPKQILEYFSDLKLMGFSAVDDKAVFHENIEPMELSNQNYACGMFWFRKEKIKK